MNYRYANIFPEYTLGAPGTLTIPLNVRDPISRIELGYKVDMKDPEMAAALAANITKIELVDGSDVLHSLNGRQNQALVIYDRRCPTLNNGYLAVGESSYATMGIDFGRFLFDPELAFDPTKFRNPQLKITHDRAQVGAQCETHTLQIFAHLFDEKAISPLGFLSAREHYTYTAETADTWETWSLPLDRTIRQLLIRGWHADVDPIDVVDYLKLSEDNDKRIPFDCNLEWYVNRMKGDWKLIQEVLQDYNNEGKEFFKYVTPTDHWTVVSGMPVGGVEGFHALDEHGVKGGKVRWWCSKTEWFAAIAQGYLPHHCIQIPFGRQDQIDDWYDVSEIGSLIGRTQAATNVGTGSEIQVIIQQLRRY